MKQNSVTPFIQQPEKQSNVDLDWSEKISIHQYYESASYCTAKEWKLLNGKEEKENKEINTTYN